jgi:outer membrane protein TolC
MSSTSRPDDDILGELSVRLSNVETDIQTLFRDIETARTAYMLIGALAGAVRWALLKKGTLTNAELAAAEQEMKASAEVDLALDPKFREIRDALQEIRTLLDRLRGDQTQSS